MLCTSMFPGSSNTPVSRDWKGGVGSVRGGGFSTQPSGDTPAPKPPWDQPCHFISLSHATQVLCPTFWVRVSIAEVTCPGSQLAESSLRFTSATCPSQEREPPLAACGPGPPRLPHCPLHGSSTWGDPAIGEKSVSFLGAFLTLIRACFLSPELHTVKGPQIHGVLCQL